MKYGEHRSNGRENYFAPFAGGDPINAHATAHWLAQPTSWQPGKRRRWLNADVSSLWWFAEFEGWAPRVRASERFDWGDQSFLNLRLDQLMGQFHAALPFDEPERRWLVSTYVGLEPEFGAKELVTEIRGQSAEIMAAGLRRVVEGRDLMRRWWAWRRDVDEFEGSGAALSAAGTLMDMNVLLEDGGYDAELPPSA